MSDWLPERRPIAPELTNPKDHAVYTPPTVWPELRDKLDNPAAQLRLAKHVV